jgi:hypothetical protein
MLNFGDGAHVHATFEADGSIDLDDRQHLLDCYSGIPFQDLSVATTRVILIRVAEASLQIPVAEAPLQIPVAEAVFQIPVAEAALELKVAEVPLRIPVAESDLKITVAGE